MTEKSKHILELLGMTKVKVENGEITKIEDGEIDYCPLWHKMHGIEDLSEGAEWQVERLMEEIGFCTENRQVEMEERIVTFGTSETMMTALENNELDSTVTVSDGAGTVITDNPKVVQGVGGRLSGIAQTTPHKKVINKLREKNAEVLDPPRINQPAGLNKALEMGHQNIGVTISSLEDAVKCREISPDAVIFGVHLTGINEQQAKKITEKIDVISGCASKTIRKIAGEKALLQAGRSIPVFALTERGRNLMLDQAKKVPGQIYITQKNLPHLEDGNPPSPLI
ncbi:methanogenesis marker 8 protein [Methanonatronarchaeum sp. AMET6-2]|uniref:methanogenesis marker 8 protein n=1 Tax=Methanonatronarchaeum sp. AMET6-2 TaxID=2933293 RepID=UPI001224F185|nr:methanogenesis marker 8 protein [Methanonatronarchaeum sp. AMET6-2]RZN62839.1 MAG: DUF2099 family protein [Methanonatronarchaeia archaeon]UOY09514.1 DUF2099 family protein [Methanonatronarchaeum sp. AMET6-2]